MMLDHFGIIDSQLFFRFQAHDEPPTGSKIYILYVVKQQRQDPGTAATTILGTRLARTCDTFCS